MSEALDDTIHYKWRVVSDSGPWKHRKGSVLRWEMTDKAAAEWQQGNPQTIIEKVPGPGEKRMPSPNYSTH